jgi:hypothetical protein
MKKFLVFCLLCFSIVAKSQVLDGKWETRAFVAANDTTFFPAGMMEYNFYSKNSHYTLTIRNEEGSKTQKGQFYYMKTSEDSYSLTLVGEGGTTTDNLRFVSSKKLVWYVEDLQGSFLLTKE